MLPLLLSLLTPRNLFVALLLSVFAGLSFTAWHRGVEVDRLKAESTLWKERYETAVKSAKICSDSVDKIHADSLAADLERSIQLELAKKEAQVLFSESDAVLDKSPDKGDTSEGFCQSANRLLDEALKGRK